MSEKAGRKEDCTGTPSEVSVAPTASFLGQVKLRLVDSALKLCNKEQYAGEKMHGREGEGIRFHVSLVLSFQLGSIWLYKKTL